MSYILDALKRADAERERGTVPGLHAQAIPLAAAGGRTGNASRPMLWLGVAVAVVAGGALAWRLLSPPAGPQAVATAPVQATTPRLADPPAGALVTPPTHTAPPPAVTPPTSVPLPPGAPPPLARFQKPPSPAESRGPQVNGLARAPAAPSNPSAPGSPGSAFPPAAGGPPVVAAGPGGTGAIDPSRYPDSRPNSFPPPRGPFGGAEGANTPQAGSTAQAPAASQAPPVPQNPSLPQAGAGTQAPPSAMTQAPAAASPQAPSTAFPQALPNGSVPFRGSAAPQAAPSLPPPRAAGPVPAQRPAPATPSAPAPPSEPRSLAGGELPSEVRSQLPALTVSGSVYSDSPASRMLIVNGQVLREGDRVTPELTLERIQPRSAVLNFRGYRYSMGY